MTQNSVAVDHWTIEMRGMEVQASIGVHDHERLGPQRLVLDVDLILSEALTDGTDRIESVTDYDFLRTAILDRIAQGHIETQEKLISDVADRCLEVPTVVSVTVASRKTDVYPDCASIGVRLTRSRAR